MYNKIDRLDDERGEFDDADFQMSVETGEQVNTVLAAVIDAVGYEPELPIDEDR